MSSALLRRDATCFAVSVARSGVIVDAEDYYRDVADAIESARGYVLIAGWQLESSVLLRRRPEDEGRARSLWEVVRAACEPHPELRLYVLAWDWASVYALDREWGTRERLRDAGMGRLEFRYDAHHPQGASHHDKLVVVDGHTAWVGGIDLCEHRWDQRSHIAENPLRLEGHGKMYLPYHDIQAVVRGPVVRDLVEHFVQRWISAEGEPLVLVPEPEPREPPRCHFDLGSGPVGIARTRGATVVPIREPVHEIRELFVEALGAAERLVYVESQYITSRAMVRALVERFRDRARPPLEIVVMMPALLEGRMEKATIEGPQRIALSVLSRVAAENGHSFAVFAPFVPRIIGRGGPEDESCPTYIHSKMMLIDDRFLTVGSANATNRSMGLDSELNLAWHTELEHDALARGIRALRVSLLAEHTRLSPDEAIAQLTEITGLVDRLRALTTRDAPAIREVSIGAPAEHGPIDDLLASLGDPERAAIAEEIFEEITDNPRGILARVVTALHDVASTRT